MKLLSTLLLLLCVSPCLAAGPLELTGFKMQHPPHIDGVVNADEWAGVPSGSGSFDAQTGDKAPEPMTFWLAYDEKYIYFAARMGDSRPKTIKALQYDTNVSLTGDDYVTLSLDLGGSLANYNQFSINPRGATSVSLEGGRANKLEWTGELIAAGRITPEGWEVETRIPWQMMRLPPQGLRDVRFNVSRTMTRTQRMYNWGFVDFAHPSDVPVWMGIRVPAQQRQRTLKLLPYSYAGYDPRVGLVFNNGLDMKSDITDKVTLVGTINPDFRNIEDQVLSLNFSRFERLPGEARPFFLEGAQYMSSQLFNSQRIGDVDAGLNMYGRLNDKTSFGLIESSRIGHENDFVSNLSFDPNPKDSYRLTVASLDQGDISNEAYLARYGRQVGPFNLFFRSMGTVDSQLGAGQYGTFTTIYQKKEWFGLLEYDWASPRFDARLGLIPEVDFRGETYVGAYDKVIKRGPVAEENIVYSGTEYTHIDGTQYRRHNEVDTATALRDRLLLSANFYTEKFNGVEDHLAQFALLFPRDDLARNLAIEFDEGKLAQLWYTNLNFTSTYRFGKRIQTSLSYQRVTHPTPQDQLIATASYDLLKKRSISGRIIKSNSRINGFISLQQTGNRGVEYFIIVGDPNAQSFVASVILKVAVPIDVLLGRKQPK